jgi:hypothetical protein
MYFIEASPKHHTTEEMRLLDYRSTLLLFGYCLEVGWNKALFAIIVSR